MKRVKSKVERKIKGMKQQLSSLHQKVQFQQKEIKRLREERDKLKQQVTELEEKLYPKPEIKVTVKDDNPPEHVSYVQGGG